MFLAAVTAPEQASGADLWFVFQGTQLLVIEEGEAARIPSRNELGGLGHEPRRTHYLGHLDGRSCFAAELEDDVLPSAPWTVVGLRRLFERLDDTALAIAGRAVQIVEWDRTHAYCGRCGTATERSASERVRVCPKCGLTNYPRLAPAVMALICRGRELLLARSPHFVADMYSALAGFVEPGESLEETLVREVREEVGIEIGNIRYFGSQPWPFPHSLMIAFRADYLSGEITPQEGEIEAADWFDIERLPRLPQRMSISRWLIDATVAEIAASSMQ